MRKSRPHHSPHRISLPFALRSYDNFLTITLTLTTTLVPALILSKPYKDPHLTYPSPHLTRALALINVFPGIYAGARLEAGMSVEEACAVFTEVLHDGGVRVQCGFIGQTSLIKAELGLRYQLQDGPVAVSCRLGFKKAFPAIPHFALVVGIDEDGTVHVQDSWGYDGQRTGDGGGCFSLDWAVFDASWSSLPTEQEAELGTDTFGVPLAGVDLQKRQWLTLRSVAVQ